MKIFIRPTSIIIYKKFKYCRDIRGLFKKNAKAKALAFLQLMGLTKFKLKLYS